MKPQRFGRLTDKPAKHEANARMRSQIAHSIFDVQKSPHAIGLIGIEHLRSSLDAEHAGFAGSDLLRWRYRCQPEKNFFRFQRPDRPRDIRIAQASHPQLILRSRAFHGDRPRE
ncbi:MULTISPECIES: hypothetical protein [unclassified Bradyrhizobium]|uniref:hypothetical protein n=1 Tax=unclassified Bradyrhizobium TaxID=2631580 RepID=UPI002FF0A234